MKRVIPEDHFISIQTALRAALGSLERGDLKDVQGAIRAAQEYLFRAAVLDETSIPFPPGKASASIKMLRLFATEAATLSGVSKEAFLQGELGRNFFWWLARELTDANDSMLATFSRCGIQQVSAGIEQHMAAMAKHANAEKRFMEIRDRLRTLFKPTF